MREEIAGWMSSIECPECHGARLKKEALAVTVGGININQFCEMSVGDELEFINHLELTEREQLIAGQVLKEIRSRLGFLRECGPGLSDPGPVGSHPLGRRKPAHPSGDPDRFLPHGRAVYPGRAEHRPAPAG